CRQKAMTTGTQRIAYSEPTATGIRSAQTKRLSRIESLPCRAPARTTRAGYYDRRLLRDDDRDGGAPSAPNTAGRGAGRGARRPLASVPPWPPPEHAESQPTQPRRQAGHEQPTIEPGQTAGILFQARGQDGSGREVVDEGAGAAHDEVL